MNGLVLNNEEKNENLIYEIRGVQVMLGSDLARLYQVEVKRINEAVKNNVDKFPERFLWKLTKEESKTFLVENFDQKIETRGGRYNCPRVFTEQGVAMLATVLKSKVATQVSIAIMDAFVTMRKYISNNLLEQKYINNMVLEHDSQIKLLQDSFVKFEEQKKTNEIYFDGQIYDAYSKILEIFEDAKKELIIIDSYADHAILDIIKRLNIKVTIITKKDNLLTKQDITRYNKQYYNLTVKYDSTFHDRYFILDNATVYHCGASINRIGYKTFSITLINDKTIIDALLNRIEKDK